ncbi:unnamed protein product [Cylicocyclus nassatus]|uniref:Uncharacterized protein n=1 Tax=Cylicocyclus nassatus TaxID=53992 RepID=A0AA36H7H2_CYLNA|nr:unnamed protein product [Cylicocyclus nassatus]
MDYVMAAPKKQIAKCYPLTNGFVNWLTPTYGYGYDPLLYGYGYAYPYYPYTGLLYMKK